MHEIFTCNFFTNNVLLNLQGAATLSLIPQINECLHSTFFKCRNSPRAVNIHQKLGKFGTGFSNFLKIKVNSEREEKGRGAVEGAGCSQILCLYYTVCTRKNKKNYTQNPNSEKND